MTEAREDVRDSARFLAFFEAVSLERVEPALDLALELALDFFSNESRSESSSLPSNGDVGKSLECRRAVWSGRTSLNLRSA